MCLAYFAWITMFIKFTNWTLEMTIVFELYLLYCASFGDEIKSHKSKLACLHLLYELAFAMNLITVPIYWGIIHAKVVFEGP